MNAQEAANIIHSGMEKLSLSELMNVHGVLKSDKNFQEEFSLVDDFSKAKLTAYANYSGEKMSFEDADALKDIVELFGRDENGDLTADGKKALDVADKAAKQAKEERIIENIESTKKSTPLTEAQKNVLDAHGFMYEDTMESLGKFQDVNAALKVLSDEGVLEEEKTQKNTEATPPSDKSTPLTEAQKNVLDAHGFVYEDSVESLGKFQDVNAALKVLRDESVLEKNKKPVEKSIPLTAEQIRYLDEHGFMHNGTLESIGWFKDKDEALKALSQENLNSVKNISSPLMDVNETKEKEEPINANELSAAQINKNMEQLDALSQTINPLDEKDERFAQSRQSLDILDVRDEKGNKYDVREELVELAKLKTEKDLHDSQKITPEDYIDRLKLNIDTAVFSIISGNEIDFSRYSGNQDKLREALKSSLDKFINPVNKESKPNKAQVRLDSVLGYMANESNKLDKFSDDLGKKFGALPFVAKFKNKLHNFDEKCEKKFGPKVWGVVRGTAMLAEKMAPAIGMALVAGAGGPIGMGLYAAYTFNKHVMPLIKKYDGQPKEERTDFRQFIKENKKDALLAGLYSASAGLSLGLAIGDGLSAMASVAETGQTLDVAAKTALWSKHANTAKAAVSGSAMLSRSAIQIYEAHKEGDSKKKKRSILIGVASAVAFAGGYYLRSLFGVEHDASEGGKKLASGLDIPAGVSSTPGVDDGAIADGSTEAGESVQVTEITDFYHGANVEAHSHESVIRLLTNSDVSRTEATLKAQMMIERVGNMDESIRATFASASDAQIAHAILLRASDVHKGDADELLRALMGDENCRQLTMEQKVEEIHKGLVGYNYGQRTDLPFGRNLDPNYVDMNTRSRFLIDDCDSERLTDRFGHKEVVEKPDDVTTIPVRRDRIVVEPDEVVTPPPPATRAGIEEEARPVGGKNPAPEAKPVAEPVGDKNPAPEAKPVAEPVPVVRKLAEYRDTQSGGRDMLNDLKSGKIIKMSDGKYYEATPAEQAAFQKALQGGRN